MRKLSDCIILLGGSSEERLVSVASGQNIAKQIPEAKLWFLTKTGEVHEVTHEELDGHADAFMKEFVSKSPVLAKTLKEALPLAKKMTIIVALHGTEGEDGTLQKLFEDNKIAFTCTGSLASATAFNKYETKKIAKKNGIQVVEDMIVHRFDITEKAKVTTLFEKSGKIVMKPLANGSSVGLFIIDSKEAFEAAWKKAPEHKFGSYLIEPFIVGREITVGVYQTRKGETLPLPCSEVRVIEGRQFDYAGKYLGKGVEELTPAPVTESEKNACQEVALKIHKAVGCQGYTRTDMILTDNGPVMMEINTLPGMSKASFIPQQLIAAGMNLRDFFEEQINLK